MEKFGHITLINYDCMNILWKLPDKCFDLAIVDPPYGIGENGSKNKNRSNRTKFKGHHNKNIVKSTYYHSFAGNDSKPMCPEYFNQIFRISKNQIIWGANHFIELINKNSSCWIVWDKDNGNNDFADCELAWTSFPKAVRKFKFKWHGMLQENMKNKEIRIHPTQKPVALYKWLLKNYAKPGDKILDTHLGSGSICIACDEMGFEMTGIELDKEYYEAAKKRLITHKLQMKLNFND